MNDLLRVLAIGLSANLDNLAAGIAYGVRRIRIAPGPNALMAGIALLFSAGSAWVGQYIAHFLSERTANLIGAVLLMGIGLRFMLPPKPAKPRPPPRPAAHASLTEILHDPERADFDHSGDISIVEALVLGVALGFNCLTNGLTAGLWKLDALAVGASCALFSFFTIVLGVAIGRKFGNNWLEARSGLIAGLIMLLLGLHQLL